MDVHGVYDARASDPSGSNALAIIFRIVIPILIHLGAVVVTRLWPTSVVRHVDRSEEFNDAPAGFNVVDNPLSNGVPPSLPSKGKAPSLFGPSQSFYVSTYLDPSAPPPWERPGGGQQQPVNPPWIEPSTSGAADPNGIHLQHEVWRQMMLAQQAQLTQKQQQQQQLQSPQPTQIGPAAAESSASPLAPTMREPHLAASPRSSQPTRQRMQAEVSLPPVGPLRYHDPTTSFGDYPDPTPPTPVASRGGGGHAAGMLPKPLVLGNGALVSSPRLSTSPRISAYLDPDLDPSRTVSRIPAYLGPRQQQQQQEPSSPQPAARPVWKPEEQQETVVTAFGSPQVRPRSRSRSIVHDSGGGDCLWILDHVLIIAGVQRLHWKTEAEDALMRRGGVGGCSDETRGL